MDAVTSIKKSLPLPVRDVLRAVSFTPRRLRGRYAPNHPKSAGVANLQAALSDALRWSPERARDEWVRYSLFEQRHSYAETLGERETLTREEAFITYAVLAARRPATVVEIGTQHGKSTRKILDMRELVDFDYRVHCFDIAAEVQHFTPGEAELHIEDVTGRAREAVLDRFSSGLIFLDARPRALIRDVVTAVRDDTSDAWSLVIHDCGIGLYNPDMRDVPDSRISSRTGVWERHELAAAFGADPSGPNLLGVEKNGHRMSIANTRHGLGVVTPTVR